MIEKKLKCTPKIKLTNAVSVRVQSTKAFREIFCRFLIKNVYLYSSVQKYSFKNCEKLIDAVLSCVIEYFFFIPSH